MSTMNIAQRMTDMLCGAIEGGSTYWAVKLDWGTCKNLPEWDTKSWWEVLPKAIAEKADFEFMVMDDDHDWHECNCHDLWQALDLMSTEYYRHFRDMIAEEDDAITADVYFQLALFGDVIYG